MAEADLERKKVAHRKLPSATSEANVERAKLVLDVSKIQLESANSKKGNSLYSLMYLQWQVEVLRNRVLELETKLMTRGSEKLDEL